MRAEDLHELHYIAPIANVPSMLQHGLLSHSRAQHLPHVSVALDVIQERRRKVVVPGGRRLHEYANTYFNARNKMMYQIKSDRGVDGLCVLRVSTLAIRAPGAVVADRNASSDYVRFDPAPLGLAALDKATIFADSWNHDDARRKWLHGSLMCAEMLIPDVIPPGRVMGAYVANGLAETALRMVAPTLPITISPRHFFL